MKQYFVCLFYLLPVMLFAQLPEGFVFAQDVVPDLKVDLRYYSKNNFVGRPIEGYYSNKLILSKVAAEKLKQVNKALQKQNLSLKVFDGYRPQRAVDFFIEWAEKKEDTVNKYIYYPHISKDRLFNLGYISHKSGHSRGSAVDLTLVNNDTGEELDMGSPYDFFGEISWQNYSYITKKQKANRNLLKKYMLKFGFKNYSKEWWHFMLVEEPFPDTYFDFVVEDENEKKQDKDKNDIIANDEKLEVKDKEPELAGKESAIMLVNNLQVASVCTKKITGFLFNTKEKTAINNANVYLYSFSNILMDSTKTTVNGEFSLHLDCKSLLGSIEANKKGFKAYKMIIPSYFNTGEKIELALEDLPKVPQQKEGEDLSKVLDLKPIYFDYGKATIRPESRKELDKVIKYLKEYPKTKIDVRSHTDSRSSSLFNLKLSTRRNTATKSYIIEVGNISRDRVSGKGYGETQLTNHCSNDVVCSDEEHQANRRTEFILII